MQKPRIRIALTAACLALGLAACGGGGKTPRGLKTIRAEDMKFHLRFLAAPEFRGRATPSAELDIASRYIAMTAERIGLKPLMPGGTFYQQVPVEVTTVVERDSRLSLEAGGSEQIFPYPQTFSPGRYAAAGEASGEVVFLGLGLSASQLGWDDYQGVDVNGRVVVLLDVSLPDEHPLKPEENWRLLSGRGAAARERGAVAVVTIIDGEREAQLAGAGLPFDRAERTVFPDVVTGQPPVSPKTALPGKPAPPAATFLQVDVRQDAGAAILGIGREDLSRMSATVKQGKRVEARPLPGRRLEIRVETETRRTKTLNVVGLVDGRDPVLRGEYVAISSHHDHHGVREGQVLPGSDDDASGVVGMFEIAEALMAERPKRSVIFVWNTAEEKGLIGSYYFVQHCPVPVGRISANLNLDMISRNDTDHLYLIGSNKLSSEFDACLRTINAKSIGLKLDDKYESPQHPDRFFFRSDQYPYIRYGIPGVWLFCGTTEDYHTAGDVEAKADYAKMEKVSRLAYLVAMDVGNRPELLKLDLHPEIRARGEENMKVVWR